MQNYKDINFQEYRKRQNNFTNHSGKMFLDESTGIYYYKDSTTQQSMKFILPCVCDDISYKKTKGGTCLSLIYNNEYTDKNSFSVLYMFLGKNILFLEKLIAFLIKKNLVVMLQMLELSVQTRKY